MARFCIFNTLLLLGLTCAVLMQMTFTQTPPSPSKHSGLSRLENMRGKKNPNPLDVDASEEKSGTSEITAKPEATKLSFDLLDDVTEKPQENQILTSLEPIPSVLKPFVTKLTGPTKLEPMDTSFSVLPSTIGSTSLSSSQPSISSSIISSTPASTTLLTPLEPEEVEEPNFNLPLLSSTFRPPVLSNFIPTGLKPSPPAPAQVPVTASSSAFASPLRPSSSSTFPSSSSFIDSTPQIPTVLPMVQSPPAPMNPRMEPRNSFRSKPTQSISLPKTPQLVFPKPGYCAKRCVRKEVMSATPQEVKEFIEAFKALATTLQQGRSLLEILVDEHKSYSTLTHGHMVFLPWHRYFLARLEQSLQTINPNVCLLYWDWSLRPFEFWKDPIFSSAYFGSSTPSGVPHAIPDGPFQGFRPGPNSDVIRREFFQLDKSNQPVVLASYLVCYSFIAQSPEFSQFHTLISGTPHVAPHEFVGGTMKTMDAPGDPGFWLHHGNMDLYWSIDQRYHDESTLLTNYPNLKEPLPYYQHPVESILDTEQLCYTYAFHHKEHGQNMDFTQLPSSVSDDLLNMFVGDQIEKVKKDSAKAVKDAEQLFKQKKFPIRFLRGESGSSTLAPILSLYLWMGLVALGSFGFSLV